MKFQINALVGTSRLNFRGIIPLFSNRIIIQTSIHLDKTLTFLASSFSSFELVYRPSKRSRHPPSFYASLLNDDRDFRCLKYRPKVKPAVMGVYHSVYCMWCARVAAILSQISGTADLGCLLLSSVAVQELCQWQCDWTAAKIFPTHAVLHWSSY